MRTINSELGSGQAGRFFWGFSFKNRKILIPALIILILIAALFLAQKFISMEMQLKRLSRYEPIYVLAIKRDLNVGDVISSSDLKPVIFYKQEYDKLQVKESNSNLATPSYISCDFDPSTNKLSNFKDVIGRVVSVPIYAGSALRQEHLAPQGTLPGLMNLLDENHTLLDLAVPQHGFNVFIKPNDFVDLYRVDKSGSNLLASKVKVILVDSMPLGKAPLQVPIKARTNRELTVSVPEEYFSNIVKAKKANTLVVTYKNKDQEEVLLKNPIEHVAVRSLFQSLMMIQGEKKEVFGR